MVSKTTKRYVFRGTRSVSYDETYEIEVEAHDEETAENDAIDVLHEFPDTESKSVRRMQCLAKGQMEVEWADVENVTPVRPTKASP